METIVRQSKSMCWENLLCRERILGPSTPKEDRKFNDLSRDFEKDVNRLIFIHPLRRLQNKTQVIPLPAFDFIHTRLTHSLEVSTVGKILGRIVGEHILSKDEYKYLKELKNPYNADDFGAIVQAACLAHDIGNPPFGHSGEKSIGDFFSTHETFNEVGKSLMHGNIKFWYDLSRFEGNAMGLRILTKDIYSGMNFTYATLGAFTKYPRESYLPEDGNIINEKPLFDTIENKLLLPKDYHFGKSDKEFKIRASQKKFGFFQSEREKFIELTEKVGLIALSDNSKYLSWCRHPLAFLVEAADDICYKLIDLEDGYRLGLIDYTFAENTLRQLSKNINEEVFKKLEKKEKISYLRNKAIYSLINDVAEVFVNNEPSILMGKSESDDLLINKIESNKIEILDYIGEMVKKNIYNYPAVLELEISANNILSGLLEIFLYSMIHKFSDPNDLPEEVKKIGKKYSDHFSEKMKSYLPEEYKSNEIKNPEDLYFTILKIVDYVAGMTDDFALNLYRKLKGIDIPRIENRMIEGILDIERNKKISDEGCLNKNTPLI